MIAAMTLNKAKAEPSGPAFTSTTLRGAELPILGHFAFVDQMGHVVLVGSLLEARAALQRAGFGVVSKLTPGDLAVLERDGEAALAHRLRTRPAILPRLRRRPR